MLETEQIESLTIHSDPHGFRDARAWVTHVATAAGFGEETARHLTLALNEACANAYRHAYGRNTQGRIDLRAEIDARGLRLTVRDYGRAFDLAEYTSPEPFTMREQGYGIFLIRKLMDEVRYSTEEVGTRVEMIKWRRPVRATSGPTALAMRTES